MNLNFNVAGKARGKLANIIAEALNVECTYMKAPTYAYEIGNFTITREGELEFDIADVSKEEIQTAVDAAKAAGFGISEIDGESTEIESLETAHESPEIEEGGDDGESPETAPQAAETADNGEIGGESGEGEEVLSISYPLGGFNPQTLDNLNKMVSSKAPLIKKALGLDSEQELPIQIDGEEVKFPWFGKCNHADLMAYAQFIECLCKTAQAKTRVTATAPESFDNEKFSMRVFCISLGMKGSQYATIRRNLMAPLSGNSGFRYEDKQPRNPRSGERVQKEVVSVRFTSEMLDKIAELASQSNMSRNVLIESIICEHVNAELPETVSAPEGESE